MFDSYGKKYSVSYNTVSGKDIKDHLANAGFCSISRDLSTALDLDSQNGFSYANTVIEELNMIRHEVQAPYRWDVYTKKLRTCRSGTKATLYVYHPCFL